MFSLNYRDATLEDIRAVLEATGYHAPKSEFAFADENDLFKFLGVSDGAARYMVGFEDGPEEDNLYASILYVKLSNKECGFSADWGGCPVFETNDVEKLVEYFEQRCN